MIYWNQHIKRILWKTFGEKVKILHNVIAKIKIIDFLLNLSLDKNLITYKKYLKLANKIDDITKYITGWVKSLAIKA